MPLLGEGGGGGGETPLDEPDALNTVSSLVNSTSSPADFTVRVTSPLIMKSPKPSRAFFLAGFCLYKLNRIGDKQYTPQNVKNKTNIYYFGNLLIRMLQSDLSCSDVRKDAADGPGIRLPGRTPYSR